MQSYPTSGGSAGLVLQCELHLRCCTPLCVPSRSETREGKATETMAEQQGHN